MREIILAAIVIPLCLMALARPLIGVYTYVWYSLLRPDILAYAYTAPYSALIAAATLLGMFRYVPAFSRLFSNPIVVGLMALQVPMAISQIYAEVPWQQLFYSDPFLRFEKMILMCLLIPVLITTVRRVWWLVLIMGASVGFLCIKFGLFGILIGGANFREGYGGMMTDNNDIALAFGMTVPLLWCMRRDIPSRLAKLVLLFASAMAFAAIVMTHSRGGAITLLVVFMLLILRSNRRLGLALMLFLCVAPSVYLVRESYFARLETLQAPTEENSAMSRVQLAEAAIETWKDHPFFGVGFGGRVSVHILNPGKDEVGSVVHNTYLQMAADSGIFAFVIYIVLLWGTIGWLETNRRKVRRDLPHLANIPEAIQIALTAFAVGSTVLSRIQFDYTYMLLMAAASWWNVYRTEMAALAASEKASAGSGPVLAGEPMPFQTAI